jgi:hypothetical protein
MCFKCHKDKCWYAKKKGCKFGNECRNFKCSCEENRSNKSNRVVQYDSGGGGGDEKFPPVAVSPSIQCDSATAKVDSSATGKVRGSSTDEPFELLTTSNIVNLKIQPGCIYYYIDKKQVKIELGKIRVFINNYEDGCFHCTTEFFTFENLDTQFNRDLLADFMQKNSYS